VFTVERPFAIIGRASGNLLTPRVDPQRFEGDSGQVVVDVHQVVRDLEGKIIADRIVRHSFQLEI
jgi:hypothetical protein